MKLKKKSLGQNFLQDKNICKKILLQSNIYNREILEIGPGSGFLTDSILENKPKKLILIEKDYDLFMYLKKKYKNYKNVNIFNMDALKYNFNNKNKINIISNLPYNISTKIILKLFTDSKHIDEMVLMIQKEVGEKFNYNLKKFNKYKFLNNICANYKVCFDVSPNVFRPKPKVFSSVVKFTFKNKVIDWKNIQKFTNEIFKNKRKKISNNINIKNKSLNLDKRVEDLNFKEILEIYNSI